jgi:hypothetical protein
MLIRNVRLMPGVQEKDPGVSPQSRANFIKKMFQTEAYQEVKLGNCTFCLNNDAFQKEWFDSTK